jgi:hypothetical protein
VGKEALTTGSTQARVSPTSSEAPPEPRTRIPMTERRATESVGAALRLAHGSCSGRVTLVGYMGNQTNVGIRY